MNKKIKINHLTLIIFTNIVLANIFSMGSTNNTNPINNTHQNLQKNLDNEEESKADDSQINPQNCLSEDDVNFKTNYPNNNFNLQSNLNNNQIIVDNKHESVSLLSLSKMTVEKNNFKIENDNQNLTQKEKDDFENKEKKDFENKERNDYKKRITEYLNQLNFKKEKIIEKKKKTEEENKIKRKKDRENLKDLFNNMIDFDSNDEF